MKTNDDGSAAATELRAFIDSMPALAWSCRSDGFPEFINQRFHEYSGLSTDQITKVGNQHFTRTTLEYSRGGGRVAEIPKAWPD